MAFELPALPNFNVQIPDLQQKALEGAQLKNMLSEMALRKALAPLQVQQAQQGLQASQTENQLKTMQLQGQQAMTDWLKNGDVAEDVPAGDFSSNDKIATFVGVTPNDPIMNVIRSMAKHNVPAPMLVTEAQGMLQRRNEFFKGTQEEQAAQKTERGIFEDVLTTLHDMPADQRGPQLAAKLPILQENSKTDPLLRAYAASLQGHSEMINQAYNTIVGENAILGLRQKKAETKEAETKAQEAAARARGEVTPQMATEQAQAIAKEKALVPTEISKAVGTEVAKQQALAPQLPQIASTTRAGRNYINREDIPKGSEGIVEQRAAAAGLPIVDKEVAGTLTDIDTAKANMQSMLVLVQKKLPQGPAERIYKGPENKLEAALQTDPDLAAMGTFRNAAIQTMRAVAGSKGLRITQSEVQMAIDNDIPKMTDTWAVAQSKINQLNTFLDNAETAHLVRNRTAAAAPVTRTYQGHTYVQQSDGSYKLQK